MTDRHIKLEFYDHVTGHKDQTTLGDFVDANSSDARFCHQASIIVPALTPGESWKFAPGLGDDYELRRVDW